ncbi:PREDICTED: meiotically up-regulated protein C1442.13c isoform X2 [Camelina sativa]|uniref:Meiotically up-regulated protein C1442.13c isoform X2 n=1 Tax=Camelina sativa TaxID=90675 RepID=A0ABM0V9A8_CAMSA|nr:PREDICTED: meiotically up-regulated protein C1442.13c isoform X2 [Camelina sativa]
MEDSSVSTSAWGANIGVEHLKKHGHGWKESTSLGIAEQGILMPIDTQVKHNKLGLRAEKLKIQWRKKILKSQATIPQNSEKVSNVMGESSGSSSSLPAINSSNIGFQLLKKHGWTEGTGLGVAEQGILVPVQAEPKNNKRGLGAEQPAKRKAAQPKATASEHEKDEGDSKKSKKLSKKMRKMMEHEKHLQEKEFERAFFREFWPDNL